MGLEIAGSGPVELLTLASIEYTAVHLMRTAAMTSNAIMFAGSTYRTRQGERMGR
jgi:hypothetical protein